MTCCGLRPSLTPQNPNSKTMIFSALRLAGVPIVVLRDDLNHPIVSGNKLHKLLPNIELAKANNYDTIASFGGPFSNHLHALAWACKDAGLNSVGIVRGELHANLTPTLRDCQRWGMNLIACPRKDYRAYQELISEQRTPCSASKLLSPLISNNLKNTLLIPEGGSNMAAINSLTHAYGEALAQPECDGITHIVCATGTGATLAGILNAASAHISVIGMQSVAEGDATLKRIEEWRGINSSNMSIQVAHLGGFGKMPHELHTFIAGFEAKYAIPLDPVYNGKAMLKLSQMIEAGFFAATDKVLFINTGGLQGKRGSQ
mgnify:CR=1 FL=1